MRVSSVYQIQSMLTPRFPNLRPAQIKGLAHWLYGTIRGASACQSSVALTLSQSGLSSYHAARQYLREWLYDGADRAAPCSTSLEVEACFPWLLAWVLDWWDGRQMILAIDTTDLRADLSVVVVSVLYNGAAIPLGWVVTPQKEEAAHLHPLLAILDALGAVMPSSMQVLLLTDRGWWSPAVWERAVAAGWYPLMRIQQTCHFQTPRHDRAPIGTYGRAGTRWIARGIMGAPHTDQRAVTAIVIRDPAYDEPWYIVTNLPSEQVNGLWYAMRMWIELGFRVLKRLGWHWQKTQRTNPARVARHWLVLAVATLLVLAYGTREEAARQRGVAPADLHARPKERLPSRKRLHSLFKLGFFRLQTHLIQEQVWRSLWFMPTPWPMPPPQQHDMG